MYAVGQKRRSQLDPLIDKFGMISRDEVAYVATKLLLKHLPERPAADDIYAVLGMLDFIKSEFTRQLLLTRSRHDIQSNGDPFFDYIRKAGI